MRRANPVRRLIVFALLVAVASVAAIIVMALPDTSQAAGGPPLTPRIGTAMGILPRRGAPDLAVGRNIPIVYHGGSVMRDVTIHTVFWAPPGYHFDGSPGAGTPGYEALIKQFLADVAHDSAAPAGIFSTLTQYADGAGAGQSTVHYDPAVDSIDAADPYPAAPHQCASPSSTTTCVTDLALQTELDHLIGTTPGARGLDNLWFIFLPPDVDTCLNAGSCATNAYAGYHSLFDLGHGATVYAPIPDPLIELTPPQGSDPEGNPEAESALDTLAHEYAEAVTDPYGTAWMDPNGFEVGDKCENGPQQGAPLGYASDGSPYNQVMGGHEYLLQDMWSNPASGCVQSTTATRSGLPLHTVFLHQFSPAVSGRLGTPARVPVTVALVRGLQGVAVGRTRTRPDGSWGPVLLRGSDGRPHGVGDDRDGLIVSYGTGRGAPRPDIIATGDGGNPFAQAGWTGFYVLDHFTGVGSGSVSVGPCSQVGVLALRVGRSAAPSPIPLCGTESDVAIVPTGRIGLGTPVTLTSEDNRAVSPGEPGGALVSLSVTLGEPGALSGPDGQSGSMASGFPACTAFERIRSVRCTGLEPGGRYRLAGHGARAGSGGVLFARGVDLTPGRALALINSAGRRLTVLHIARLRVAIDGNQTVVASGVCQPGEYYGAPLTHAPISKAVGLGPAGAGTVCPGSGKARGLPTADIAQTDDLSGGQTETQVPLIAATAPLADETMYGGFLASAQSSLPGPHGAGAAAGTPIALTIRATGTRRAVFHCANVDTARGVAVRGLAPGAYTATWVLHDANGDTRTVLTRFTEQ